MCETITKGTAVSKQSFFVNQQKPYTNSTRMLPAEGVCRVNQIFAAIRDNQMYSEQFYPRSSRLSLAKNCLENRF